MDLKESEILGSSVTEHWYYRSKARAMLALLKDSSPSTILDIGAGSGFFSRYLLSNTSASSACCVDISYPHDTEGTEANKPIYFRRSIDKSDANLVLLMDVLEHVEDDIGLLMDYVSKVPIGTRFLISVPAFEFLWSEHDVFLEHFRRYHLKQLELVVQNAGLKPVHTGYYFATIFPLAVALRFLNKKASKKSSQPKSDLRKHHSITNHVLNLLCGLEIPFMRVNRIAGLTIFCLAEKK